MAGPIMTKFGMHMICGYIWEWFLPKKISPTPTQGAFWGVKGVHNSQIWESFQTTGPIGTKFVTRMQIHLGMDIGKNINSSRPHGQWGEVNVTEMPHNWTERDQIWHTCADSSGNGLRLKN